MNLSNYKSMLVQNVACELNMLQKGQFECANKMLNFRHGAYIRVYMIECYEDEYATYKEVIDYLYEQVKEITTFISQSNC